MHIPLPIPLLLTLLLTSPALTTANPSPKLVPDNLLHLMPRNTLFYRQVAAVSNLQTFNGSLGGAAAGAITESGDAKRPFAVGGDTFPDFKSAAQRTCDNQFNECSQTANKNGGGNKGGCR